MAVNGFFSWASVYNKENESRAGPSPSSASTHLLGIPGIIGGFVERAVNDGRHQEDADQYGADKTPCDLPVRPGHVTRHLQDILRESAE